MAGKEMISAAKSFGLVAILAGSAIVLMGDGILRNTFACTSDDGQRTASVNTLVGTKTEMQATDGSSYTHLSIFSTFKKDQKAAANFCASGVKPSR
jgi:hypothetical protein